MGNCCERCLGRLDKRRYLRTRYNVERDISIEFENLMDEEAQELETPKGQLEFNTPFTVSSYMKWLVHQDEELRREEEAYYQALQNEAAASSSSSSQAVKTASRRKEKLSRLAMNRDDPNKWLGDNDSDWEMAGGEEDFDMFMECVKARSAAAQTRALNSQALTASKTAGKVEVQIKTTVSDQLMDSIESVHVPLDVASETSSKDDRSKTEASSIDLEWEHEAGMQPLPRQKRQKVSRDAAGSARVVQDIAELAVRPMISHQSPAAAAAAATSATTAAAPSGDDVDALSDDFEWDSDFGVANNQTDENRTLLSKNSAANMLNANSGGAPSCQR